MCIYIYTLLYIYIYIYSKQYAHTMVPCGVWTVPADAIMHKRPIGRGYVQLRETGLSPWPETTRGKNIYAHEFHYASIENLSDSMQYAYDVVRGHGIDGKQDSLILKNVVANFSHQRGGAGNLWPQKFTAFVRSTKYKN